MDDHFRASDADRDYAAEQLRVHYAAGRLTFAEYNERLPAVFGAVTLGALSQVMSDLPEEAPANPEPIRLRRRDWRRAVSRLGAGVVAGLLAGLLAGPAFGRSGPGQPSPVVQVVDGIPVLPSAAHMNAACPPSAESTITDVDFYPMVSLSNPQRPFTQVFRSPAFAALTNYCFIGTPDMAEIKQAGTSRCLSARGASVVEVACTAAVRWRIVAGAAATGRAGALIQDQSSGLCMWYNGRNAYSALSACEDGSSTFERFTGSFSG